MIELEETPYPEIAPVHTEILAFLKTASIPFKNTEVLNMNYSILLISVLLSFSALIFHPFISLSVIGIIFIISFAIATFCTKIWIQKCKIAEIPRLLHLRLSHLLENDYEFKNEQPYDGTFANIKRDGQPRRIAVNMLVPGDRIHKNNKKIAAYSLLVSPREDPEGYVEIIDFPAIFQLKRVLEMCNKARNPSILDNQRIILTKRLLQTMCFICALSLLVNIAKTIISALNRFDIIEFGFLLVYQPLMALFPVIILLNYDVFEFLVDRWLNAELCARYAQWRVRGGEASDIPSLPVELLSTSVLQNFAELIAGKSPFLSYNINGFRVMSSVTTVCFIDREGILSEGRISPEHVCTWTDKPQVVDVIQDHTGGGFTLEADWRDSISTLKPIGLCSLLCSSCEHWKKQRFRDSPTWNHRRLSAFKGKLTDQQMGGDYAMDCVCQLGEEMGFQEAAVLSTYKVVNTLRTVVQEAVDDSVDPLMSMSGYVTQCTYTGVLQYFSRGSPELVLNNCAYIWNGSAVIALDSEEAFNFKLRVSQIANHWENENMDVFAFAYTPVPPQYKNCIMNTDFNLCVLKEGSEETEREDSFSWSYTERTDENAENALEIVSKLQKTQIFLGLISTHHQPKRSTAELVEDLTKCGVRFVHFSRKSKKQNVHFLDKIGIETDWNFYISLQPPQTNDSKTEVPVEIDGNISKLPVGISSIRPHLDSVDNVPLLVSLFTDCTPESTGEMIEILDEYGEICMTVGSDLRFENSEIFVRSDISVSIQSVPVFEGCLLHPPEAPETDARYLYYSTVENAYSSVLTSIFCVFALPYTKDFRSFFEQVTSNARRSLYNMTQCVFFTISTLLIVSFAQLFAMVLGMPPLLEFYQMIWICIVLLPVLSFSLLFTKAKPNIMSIIASKNEAHFESLRWFAAMFLVRGFPTSVVYPLTSLWYLKELTGSAVSWRTLLWNQRVNAVYVQHLPEILSSQVFSMGFFVYWLLVSSVSFLYRVDSIFTVHGPNNYVWLFTCFFTAVLQVMFSVAILRLSDVAFIVPSWRLLLFMFAYPLLTVFSDEVMKHFDRHFLNRFQRRMRIVFDTKLGMHSPK